MSATTTRRTAKYNRRLAELLDVASEQINIHGTRGMTLTAVARALDLDTSSVTYYFKRKDQLAAACLERTLRWLLETAQAAAAKPEPRQRARYFLHEHFELHRRQRDPRVPKLALLSDMFALDRDVREPLDTLYAEAFRTVRGFFEPVPEEDGRARALLATVVLFANVFWLPAWIERYMASDFERVEARLFDVLENGLAGGCAWPMEISSLEDEPGGAQERFLHAATNLINREGYVGASVEKIAAELGVSTGSFYHHLDNKDDLVVACFRRSFALIKRAQVLAAERGGKEGEQLSRMVASLVALQFAGDSPLLRTNAYLALPPDLRQTMLNRTSQVTRHVAGQIADAIIDGSLRPVDPVIGGHAVMAAINAAADLRRWAEDQPLEIAVARFSQMLRDGIF